MDFKGIAWVGNVYQKFEAMCLEVEEVVYEDTVKYMEGQMQKVSGSVKKFYTEIMDDLNPSSGDAPAKYSESDLVWDPFGHVHLMKKPRDIVPEEKEVGDAFDFAAGKKDPPLVFVEDLHCGSRAATKSPKLGACRRPIGIKRISKTTGSTLCSSPASSLSGRCNPEDAAKNIASAEVTEKVDSECNSTNPVETIRSTEIVPVKQKASSELTESSYPGAITGDEKDERDSNICVETPASEPASHEIRLSSQDHFEMELIEKVEDSDPETETCVMVEAEGTADFEATPKSKPSSSYKKKIGEGLAAKLRQKKKKKREYSPSPTLLESDDWEIL